MEIIAVIVTYADRHEFTSKVIDACLREGVDSVILVDNASKVESRKCYEVLAKSDARIRVIFNVDNLGSAGGYKIGISHALEYGKDSLLWLLDDDNLPEPGALNELISVRETFVRTSLSENIVLYSYRGSSRLHDYRAVRTGEIKGYKNNNFLGFNFSEALLRKLRRRDFGKEINYPVVRVNIGPWGGMFISSELFRRVGLPNDEFYLYADDHDFAMKLNQSNVDQYLVRASVIQDIDESFTENNPLFSINTAEFKIYYSIRNHTYLSQKFIEYRFLYIANKALYLLWISIKALGILKQNPKHFISRLKLILRSISDGEKRKLGRVFYD